MKNFSDKDWALIELSKDSLFHKINRRDIPVFIDNALRIGVEQAQNYKSQDIYDLYRVNQIEIERSDKSGILMNYRLRAEYVKKDNQSTVILYPNSFIELKKDWNHSLSEEEQLTDSAIEKLHLVHEFFHWIEFSMEKPVPQMMPKVVALEIPLIKWRRTATILQTSEIAAHAFTKEFLGLSYFPTYLDYLTLIDKGEITLDELETLLIL